MSDPKPIQPAQNPDGGEATLHGEKVEPPAAPPKPLTPEEQMAAFEKELKEQDWGHQPC
jgi:hypothetical protein